MSRELAWRKCRLPQIDTRNFIADSLGLDRVGGEFVTRVLNLSRIQGLRIAARSVGCQDCSGPALLLIHLIVTIARLFGPGRNRCSIAESLLVKHQLWFLNRSHERATSLQAMD